MSSSLLFKYLREVLNKNLLCYTSYNYKLPKEELSGSPPHFSAADAQVAAVLCPTSRHISAGMIPEFNLKASESLLNNFSMTYPYEVKIKGTRTSIFNKMEMTKWEPHWRIWDFSPCMDSKRGHEFAVLWQAERCCAFSAGSNYISFF